MSYAKGVVMYGYPPGSPVEVTSVCPNLYGGHFLAGDDYYNLCDGRISWAPWVCHLTLTAASSEFKELVRNTQGCPRWLAHVDSLPPTVERTKA